MNLNLIISIKNSYVKLYYLVLCLVFFSDIKHSFAIPTFTKDNTKLPVILKAKTIEGDKDKQLLIAKGNVEVSKGL